VTSLSGGETRARNRASFDGAFGRVYSFLMEWLGRVVAAAYWGGDARPFYRSVRAIGTLPEEALVVDAPCGAGVAFAALSLPSLCKGENACSQRRSPCGPMTVSPARSACDCSVMSATIYASAVCISSSRRAVR
jgi:hypothetical protein